MENILVLLQAASKSDDFMQSDMTIRHMLLHLSFYNSIINHEMLHRDLFTAIQYSNAEIHDLNDLKNVIPIEGIKFSSNLSEISLSLLHGFIYIQLDTNLNEGLLINIADVEKGYRKNNLSENEYSVIGPQVAFVEDLDTNLNLLRKEIISDKLVFEEQIKGSISKARVVIAYMDGIVNPQHLNTVRQRLMDLDFDVIFDTSTLAQIMSDNSNTPFPLIMSTERVDRMKFNLINGHVAVLSSGSPYVISGPTTMFDFFYSPEDFYLPWVLGSFFRLIRYVGVTFSIFASPIYVSVITFHYSVVPRALLGPIIESRTNVPFPPFLEVLFMEITVELLREAGARLPTKVGQTLGIVGGVVLGEAAVQAGLTSNNLIIIVSLSALASFATPIFKMANTIRFLRFPMIFLSAAWGGLGIMIGVMFLLGHLLRLKSFGAPYLVPVFPFRAKGFKEFLRLPYSLTWNRPGFLRPRFARRYTVRKHKDIGDDYNNE
ncbi:spore germination protein [Paenibacillus sp. Soil750]|uniref:spore germination protein n=1 Tax=Paenibacillus sp. Soil750 TaxID=1736398 RepID=UPI0006F202BF|nr:spore germination protein [Paenibacillus sp. Soil750]KRE64115.1 spore gernimation protein GerA [Paenibacillus sp. Soil750]